MLQSKCPCEMVSTNQRTARILRPSRPSSPPSSSTPGSDIDEAEDEGENDDGKDGSKEEEANDGVDAESDIGFGVVATRVALRMMVSACIATFACTCGRSI
jgi:hypothetical protein